MAGKIVTEDSIELVLFLEHLADLRKAKGISQRDVARLLNTSQSSISALECLAHGDLRLSKLCNYARSFGYKIVLHAEEA